MVEAPRYPHLAVAGSRLQAAVDALDVERAVAGAGNDRPFHVGDRDPAVRAFKLQLGVRWNRYVHFDAVLTVPYSVPVVVRVAQLDGDRVSGLVLEDADSAGSDLVVRSEVGLDLVACARNH